MRYFNLPAFILLISLNLYSQQDQVKHSLTFDTILLKDVTISSTIPLNTKQIEKFYRTNYFSTIDNLTSHLDGVSLIKRGAYAMEPQMNGFSGGQLNITIDGMKMFGACTDKMDPVTSYLEPSNLDGITLEHGTNCSDHGNNIGGSIDLTLKEPELIGSRHCNISLMYGYESVSNSRNILLSTGYFRKQWTWGINSVYRKNESYRDGLGGKIRHSQFEKFNVHSVLKYAPDTISVFRTDLLWDLASNVGYPALPMDVSKARAALVAIEYQRIKPKLSLKAKVYYNSVYHVMDDSKRDSLFFLKNSAGVAQDSVFMRMDMPGWSNTFGSYIQANIPVNAKNKLTIKADNYLNTSLAEMTMHMHFPRKQTEPAMFLQSWPDMLRCVTGFFVSNTSSFSSNLSMIINGRVDFNFDRFQSSVAREQFSVLNYNLAQEYNRLTKSLNVTVTYLILKSVLLSLQAGLSERMPTNSEQYGYYLFNAYDGYDYIGNPALKTEKSISSKIAVTYYNRGLKINLSQSFNYLRDYIIGMINTSIPPMNFYTNGLRVYSNIPGARLHSSDLQIMYRPSGKFSFFILTKYTWGQLSQGAPLPLIPPLKNIISLSYELKGWLFQADNETAFSQKRINSDYGETITPSYTLFNFKTSRHIMTKSVMIDCSAGITNVFNINYYEHLDWGHIPRPGRSINLSVKLTY